MDIGIQGSAPDKCEPGDWNKDGTGDALIRRYVISYDPAISHISFLTKITRFSSDGVNYLPPISFSYSVFSPQETTSAAGAIITSTTVGYGDITPETIMGQCLSVALAFIGTIFFGLVLAVATQAFAATIRNYAGSAGHPANL